MFFWQCVAIVIAPLKKNTEPVKTTVILAWCWFGTLSHGRKNIDGHLTFFWFLYSGIPDLALGILKMLIHVCFRDVLQPVVNWFVPGIMRVSASLYRKCTVFTVSLCPL